MKIAIASGKGGTGKTTVCASLATVWVDSVVAVDLDVEEPNLHLFLNPNIADFKTANIKTPVIDKDKCTGCGVCSDFCQFNAIGMFGGDVPSVFPEMCHGCNGCFTLCPAGAISAGSRELGKIKWGKARNNIDFVMGCLRVGEAMSPPLMREVKKHLIDVSKDGQDVIIDAPPGTSCPAINAVMDVDYIVLVTEPTPFGLHDLKLVVEAFEPLGKPMGVVVNKSGLNDAVTDEYCKERGFDVLAKIPFKREVAKAYSKGQVISDISSDYADLFKSLAEKVRSYA